MSRIWTYLLSMLLIPVFYGNAQEDFNYLKNLSEEDSSAIDALILYPKETRDAMLEASLHPEALVRLHKLQAESSRSFTTLMAPLSKDEQEKFWDIVRYPGLVKRLA